MAPNRREELYNNLINSGKVSANEIGTLQDFIDAITDEQSARQLHANLLGSGLLTEAEIGSADDFYGSISSDFAKSNSNNFTTNEANLNGQLGTSNSQSRQVKLGNLPSVGEMMDEHREKTRMQPAWKKEEDATTEATPSAEDEWQQVEGTGEPITKENKKELDNKMREMQYGVERTGKRVEQVGKYAQSLASNPFDNGAQKVSLDKTENVFQRSNPRVVEETKYNPEKGEYEQTYLNEAGEYDNKALAERDQEQIDRQRYVETHPDYLADTNRIQVASLSQAIENRLGALTEDVRKKTDPVAYSTYMALNGGKPYESVAPGYAELQAAKLAMRDAQRLIDEADYNSQHGTFKDWIEKTMGSGAARRIGHFGGELARGFGQKLFDVDTWDMAETDLNSAGALLKALDRYDSGKELTEEQMMLLDAKSIELATRAYFGSSVGWGYEAGQVTAESLPFMLEMMINPASGTGKTLAGRLSKYALKRFGKKAGIRGVENMTEAQLKRAVIGAVGKKALKPYIIAGRLMGDVLGSGAMSLTTGLAGVAADTESRMAGDVKSDTDKYGQVSFSHRENAKDIWESAMKAFGSRTFDNHSEMVGEYFSPILGALGRVMKKGVAKGASKLAGKSITIEDVNRVVRGFTANDIAKMVTDFEKHAQFHGTAGEFIEEIVGGMENAILVGDQTLDTDEETGLFNGENLIKTFLGVGVFGGVMSGIKAVGYRSYKHKARKNMMEQDELSASMFNDKEKWGQIRNTIAVGSDDDIAAVLEQVRKDDSLTQEQKIAAFKYAQYAMNYRGVLQAEQKRREEQPKEHTELEMSYDNGYNLQGQEMNDARNMYELQRKRAEGLFYPDLIEKLDNDPIGALGELKGANELVVQTAIDYVNAKATYDGMMQKVEDEVEGQVNASNAIIDSRKHKATDMIQPVVLKGGEKVYIVDGRLAQLADGSVDTRNSDMMLIAKDESGKIIYLNPSDIASVDEAIDAEQEKQATEQVTRETIESQANDQIEGKLPFNVDDTYTVLGEDGQPHTIKILPAEEGQMEGDEVLVSVDDAYVPEVRKMADIQQMSDAYNAARLQAHEQEKEAKRAEEVALTTQQTDGGTLDNAGGEASPEKTGANEPSAATTANNGQPTTDNNMPMMEVGGKQKPDFDAATPERAHKYIYNERGLTREEADAFVDTNIKTIDKEIAAQQGKAPKFGTGKNEYTDLDEFTEQKVAWQAQMDALNARKAKWEAIKAEQAKVLEAEKKATPITEWEGYKVGQVIRLADNDGNIGEIVVTGFDGQGNGTFDVLDENGNVEEGASFEAPIKDIDVARREAVQIEAQAEEKKRREEVERKKAEQAALGANNVAPAIREKWNASPKVEGVRNEIVLANGERVPGKYVLVESGAATPSHNPTAEFTKNEGFPVDENEQTVNDRDYERDKDAQTITRQIASNYDQRALQTPVVVSKDGIVLSGNGRTMAGELAAKDNTDTAYIEYLKEYGAQYGFTPEQIESMQHPRIVFVPDADMPYTAETFAKFNQQEMKGQSKTEQAVKLGKLIDDDTFGRIVRMMNNYETLGEFYNDTKAATQAINELRNAGAISAAQYTEMFDGDAISAAGREMIENMLIGKAFENNPDVLRELTELKSLRQSILAALGEITNNAQLGENYSLEDELSQAINLAYQARKSGYAKAGDKVSGFARQLNLFDYDEGESVADFHNATVMMLADMINDSRVTIFRRALSLYNSKAKEAANGQMDLFSGDVETKEDILKQVKQILDYGTKESAKKPKPKQGKQGKDSSDEDGSAGTSDTGSRASGSTEEVGEATYQYHVGDTFDIIDENGERRKCEVTNEADTQGDIVVTIEGYGSAAISKEALDEYRRKADNDTYHKEAEAEIAAIAAQLEEGNSAKNDELIQKIADIYGEGEAILEAGGKLDARQQARHDAAEKWMEENVWGEEESETPTQTESQEQPVAETTEEQNGEPAEVKEEETKPAETKAEETKPETKKAPKKAEQRPTESKKDKIDDVGEVIEGARKQLLSKMSMTFAEATKQALADLPFAKAFKKPDLKKAIENGVLREKDAIFYEVFFNTGINQQKPKVTMRDERMKKWKPDYKTDLEKWIDRTYETLQVLKGFIEADEATRDEIIDKVMSDRFPNREAQLAEIERVKALNPNKTTWGDNTTPNSMWITYEVLQQLGHEVGDKVDLPFSKVEATTDGTGYILRDAKGNRLYLKQLNSVDDAIAQIVWLAKLKRGDSDIQHPVEAFSVVPTESVMGETGRYEVMWMSGLNIKTQTFDTKEEADAAAAKKKGGARVTPERKVVGRKGYKVAFHNPLTGERFYVNEEKFDTKEEGTQYLDSDFDALNEAVNKKLEEQRNEKKDTKKKELTADDVIGVGMVFTGGKWQYGVWIDKKYANNYGMNYPLKEGFATMKEAKEYNDKVKDEVFKAWQEAKESRKAFAYFDTGEDSRRGEDWRSGKDVTAEDFMNEFGFRGVQFGNWTNQRDRQMAINQAYDAFMDLAKLIGVSPKALSLNGELGIAFGARGVGNALAHYEPSEIVINLTKKRGAGSLAHEWWHALDNYFARTVGEPGGMVTDDTHLKMRDELRKAFNDMLDKVRQSDYYRRSMAEGDYWGRMHEVTARLLAEWVDQELKKRGELNTFLSRGANVEPFIKVNYDNYVKTQQALGEEPMPYEEYRETKDALRGMPYPSAKEVEEFADAMRNIFDTIQERVDEETGKTILYQKAKQALPASKEEKKIVKWLADLLNKMGIKTSTDWKKGQRVLDEANGRASLMGGDKMSEMRAYHGSGADFDAFDHSHMGEGEGAQAYGWGSYVTEVEGIGRTYAKSSANKPIGSRRVLYKGEDFRSQNTEDWPIEKESAFIDLAGKMMDMGRSARVAKDMLLSMTNHNIINSVKGQKVFSDKAEGYKKLISILEGMTDEEYDERKQKDEWYDLDKDAYRASFIDKDLARQGAIHQVEEWLDDAERNIKYFASQERRGRERYAYLKEFDENDFTREEPQAVLYTVEIPDGLPYLEYNKKMGEQQDILDSVDNELTAQGWKRQEIDSRIVFTNPYQRVVLTPNQSGADLYEELKFALGGAMAASDFLRKLGVAGIKYPAEYRSGGRSDGASNYVIFDENDLKITDKIKFFRTKDGEAYGFTLNGEIYLDPRIATSETPIHEYAHLWSEALEQANPQAWQQLKNELMNDTELLNYVKGLYPDIKDENELMHEVFSHFAGAQGKARLDQMRREEMAKADGFLNKARVAAMFHRLAELLDKYWNMARDLFAGKVEGLGNKTKEDFADMLMSDLLRGFNPNMKNNGLRFQFVGEQGAEEADRAEGSVARIEALATAKQMEADGKPALNIKMATGWERGKDGKWRYEIEDDIKAVDNGIDAILDKERKALKDLERKADALMQRIYRLDAVIPRRLTDRFSEEEKAKYMKMREERFKLIEEWHKANTEFRKKEDDWRFGDINTTLGEILGEDYELFKYYPDLKSMPVIMNERLDASGSYEDGTIKLRTSFDMASTLLHEMQHAVQRKEGFARGGNMGSILNDDEVNEVFVTEVRNKLNSVTDKLGVVRDAKGSEEAVARYAEERGISEDEARAYFDSEEARLQLLEREYNHLFEMLGKNNMPRSTAFEYYQRIAGEVEARNVQKRAKMSAEERRRSLAEETEDIYRGDQIVTYGNTNSASLGDAPETFDERKEHAIREIGVVMPGLKDAKVHLVEVPKHPYKGSWEDAKKAAIEDAANKFSPIRKDKNGRETREPIPLSYNNFGQEFTYTISKNGLKESLNTKQVDKSVENEAPRGVHLSVLNELDKVINESIEIEEHPDYIKNENEERNPENGYKEDTLIHVFAGLIRVDGQYYRVRTTMIEHKQPDMLSRQYAYDVAKIEVFNDESLNTSDGVNKATKGLYSVANLLQDVEKSYDKGKKVLEESEKSSNSTENVVKEVAESEKLYRLREKPAPKKTGIGYKVFVLKDGKLYPPMVANPNGEPTPMGVWLDADAAPVAGTTKTGRQQVKAGGRGTQGGSGMLAYRPGWHLGEIPYALQFNRINPETGEKELFPANFVWAEVEYANDVDYQQEAHDAGVNANGKYQHSLAGLPRVPENGSYKYRTNPNPETDPWIITGAMKVNRILTPTEVDDMVRREGREPQQRQAGAVTDEQVRELNAQISPVLNRDGAQQLSYEESLAASKEAGYTKKQHDSWWNRTHRNMRKDAEDAVKKLHLEGIVDIYDSADELDGKEGVTEKDKKSKGWFDKRTGKIAIILGNHGSAHDVLQTILHEGVAHYGLRKLFGKHFEDFIYNVYSNASPEIRREIDKLIAKNGWNYETATEEYLASLAEDTNFDSAEKQGWWQEIKNWFIDMLHKVGLKGFEAQDVITDNELRYLLWRSYRNLQEPGLYRNIVDEAIDITMRHKLGVGRSDDNSKLEIQNSKLKAAEPAGIDLNDIEKIVAEPEADGFVGGVGIHLTMKDGNTYHLWVETDEENGDEEYLGTTEFYGNEDEEIPGEEMTKRFGKFFGEHVNTIFGTRLGELLTSKMTQRNGITLDSKDIAAYNNVNTKSNPDGEALGTAADQQRMEYAKNAVKKYQNTIGLFKGTDGLFHSTGDKMKPFAPDELDEVMQKLIKSGKRVALIDDIPSAAEGVSESEALGYRLHRSGIDDATPRAIARDSYERLIRSGMEQFTEAVQDSIRSLKNLYSSILNAEGNKKNIKDVAGYENAYLGENRMHSASQAQIAAWNHDFFQPIVEEVYELVGDSEEANERLNDYLMAKHGLERNEVLAARDATAAAAEGADYDEALAKFRQKDYSGLTALTGEEDLEAAEAAAQQMVEDFENEHATDVLWDRINAATKSSLEKMFRSGLMSKERYEKIRDMFKYYIPLQGFEETVAEDMYSYVGSDGTRMYGTPIRTAKGRKSKADNPIATIGMNGEAAIRQGNRNEMKQHFLNFVQAHPSDLVSVGDVWLRYNDVTGEWEQYFDAGLRDEDSPEEVERKTREFEERMRQLAASDPDHYKRGGDAIDIPFRVLSTNDRSQHQVIVRRGGKTFVLTINGNPRAAQALNGITNPDVFTENWIGKAMNMGQWVNRNLSALYTTRNPEFMASNYIRDAIYSNCMTWVKESPSYALRYHKNFGKMNPALMGKLFVEWENGTLREKVAAIPKGQQLGEIDALRKHFYDFIMNGGETGWTNLRDIERHKRDLEAAIKREGSTIRKAWKALGGMFDLANRAVENSARFAAFVTSREMGRSIERSVWDAKEVSVNFNKKGAGDKFLTGKEQTKLGQLGATMGGVGRSLFVFFNAGVQGLNNIVGATKEHPFKAAGLATSLYLLGAMMPILTKIVCGGDGDDDDKDAYYNLPEYKRRSNICFRWRNDMPFITIPLPIEFRAIYGLGELAAGVISGKERYNDEELAKQITSQISQVLPLDFMEGGGGWHAFVPSSIKPFVEAQANTSWTGLPIYKENKFKPFSPQWTRAYDNTDKTLVEMTKWLNDKTGGIGDVEQGWIDWNPAKIEYMLKGYLGGPYTMYDRFKKSAETILGKREFEWRNAPIASRFVFEGDDRTAARKAKSEYFDLLHEYEETKAHLNDFQKKVDSKSEDYLEYAKRINYLHNSKEYMHYQLMDYYKPLLDIYNDMKKEADEEEKTKIEAEEDVLRRELIDVIHAVDDGKAVDVDKYVQDTMERMFGSWRNDIRKKAGSIIAKQLGGTDYYGSSSATESEYGKAYEMFREKADLEGDVKLQVAVREAKEAGNTNRESALESTRRAISDIKKYLVSGVDQHAVMEDIRTFRNYALTVIPSEVSDEDLKEIKTEIKNTKENMIKAYDGNR